MPSYIQEKKINYEIFLMWDRNLNGPSLLGNKYTRLLMRLMQDEGCRPSYPINETRRPVDGAVGPIRSGVGPNDSRSTP